MSKLWSKSSVSQPENWVETFTIGRDRDLDEQLAVSDILASIAHAEMLAKVGLVEAEEGEKLVQELQNLYKEVQAGHFSISESMEDVHSEIEYRLTQKVGEGGKKIHSGRSRNDQVLVALKIFFRRRLQSISEKIAELIILLLKRSEESKHIYLPGYTHLQVAMPSTFGLWFGAYAESLIDDLMQLQTSFRMVNRNPLGSGAGYGSSFPLDREMTTKLLGFEGLNQNVVYAQMGRGKAELSVAWSLASVGQTFGRFAMDCCLYMSQNFGFISLPDAYTTGSSIMPHKKNPDVFEILRGRMNQMMALPNEISLLISNLPSGYHRELQLMKEAIFPALDDMEASLNAMLSIIPQVQLNEQILEKPIYDYLFSVDAVHDLVNQGVPFRDAYKQVGEAIESGQFVRNNKGIEAHTSLGSMGNLATDKLQDRLKDELSRFGFEQVNKAENELLGKG